MEESHHSCPGHVDGDPTPKRRLPAAGDHVGDDLLSALPDELLIAILELVDSRTAVATSALSCRWRRLDPAGNLSAFEFSVAIHLPPEYAAAVDLYRDARARDGVVDWAEVAALGERASQCEDRAMEAYARGLACFLRSPARCPRARSLLLEFFVTTRTAVAGPEMEACFLAALRWPGLERLGLHAVPRAAAGRAQPAHAYPVAVPALDGGGPAASLAALHVTNCRLCLNGSSCGYAFPALSSLTVQFTPRVAACFGSTEFNNILRCCRQIVSLHLVSCDSGDMLTVDLPPESRLQELVIEACNYGEIKIVSAPSLERLVLERCSLYLVTVESASRLETLVCRGSVPRLCGTDKLASLRFVELSVLDPVHGEYRLASFLKGIPNVQELSLCFRGRMIWVEPEHSQYRFENIKKLLINLPRLWSLHWMKQIVRIAPSLEKLHINIFEPSSEVLELDDIFECDITTADFQHTYLKEIEMVGFHGAEKQTDLIRFFMSSCRALKTLILIRHHALLERKNGQQGGIPCPSWLMEDEKVQIVSKLRRGIHSDVEIILG